MKEEEPLLQTYYLVCDLHGLIQQTTDLEQAFEWIEDHEEATDGWCTVSLQTTMPLTGGQDGG